MLGLQIMAVIVLVGVVVSGVVSYVRTRRKRKIEEACRVADIFYNSLQ
jgi:hypothetical protein